MVLYCMSRLGEDICCMACVPFDLHPGAYPNLSSKNYPLYILSKLYSVMASLYINNSCRATPISMNTLVSSKRGQLYIEYES